MKSWLDCSALGVCALLLLLASRFAVGQVAVTTYHNDNYRSGLNPNETVLTPSNVNEVRFGKRLVLPVTGYVYAQPLYVPGVNINGTQHNVVYVATSTVTRYMPSMPIAGSNCGRRVHWHLRHSPS